MSVSFNIKVPDKILKERKVDDYGAVQRKLDHDVLLKCENYVPKRSGALIISGWRGTKIGSGIISYSAPYARYQYYGVSKKGKPLHYRGGGLRGSYWFLRMKSTLSYTLLYEATIKAGGISLPKNIKRATKKAEKAANLVGNVFNSIFK